MSGDIKSAQESSASRGSITWKTAWILKKREVKILAQVIDNNLVRKVAEREGFEPSVGITLRIFSKDVLSTTQPSLRVLLITVTK